MAGRFPKVRDLISFCKGGWHGSSSTAGELHDMVEKLAYVLSTWEMIQATLMDVEDMEIRKEFAKRWLHEVNQLAYEAEDVLDACEYELLRIEAEGVKTPQSQAAAAPERRRRSLDVLGFMLRAKKNQTTKSKSKEGMEKEVKEVCKFPFSLLDIAIFRDDVPEMVGKLKERMDQIGKLREAVETKDEKKLSNDGYMPKRSSSLIHPDGHIVGRVGVRKNLLQMLKSNDVGGQNPVIDGVPTSIAVTGMPGSGKTTLVGSLYNDGEIQDHFDLKGWFCVSTESDDVKLTKATIESLTGEGCGLTLLDTCQKKLKSAVQGKKFLLVLDDVWDPSKDLWERFYLPLRAGAKGSKVLITTRNEEVAAAMKAGKRFIKLEGLSDEDSWSLFKRCAFNDGEPTVTQDRLEEIRNKILKKCRGLPLTLKVLGSLLSHHGNNEQKWTEVLDSEIEDIREVIK